MLDNKKILRDITKNKNFKIRADEPFSEVVINFMIDFSNGLKKEKGVNNFPDLIYLMFWCNKKKIYELKNNHSTDQLRLGRGLIFHITPSNVPTNFIYSFFFGLLSGNSNIVRLPSKSFPEKKIILSLINKLFKNKKYINLKNSNLFLNYEKNENQYTKNISSICDGRIIWGGNETINQIRKFWIPERAVELTFADRYSISIINLNHLKQKKDKDFKLVVKNFFYDSYMMNQSACNSPHFVFWIGKKSNQIQNKFWNVLSNFVNKKFYLDEKSAVDKYSNLIENIFIQKKFENLKMYQNNLYVINPNKNLLKIENIRGINGTFFQKNISKISNLKNFITKKCQTVTYLGLEKNELKKFLTENNLFGVDRVVPIGKGLEIDTVWDGYDIINNLSRIITLK